MTLEYYVEKFAENYARYIHAIQLILGFLLILIACQIDGACFGILYEGVKTEGKIVELRKEARTTRNSTRTAYMPIVEFKVTDKTIRFKDRMDTQPLLGDIGGLNSVVSVLYSPKNTDAIIDRGLFNCFPWSLFFLIGSFLVLIGIKGMIKRQPEHTNTIPK